MKYKEDLTQEEQILTLLRQRGSKGVYVYELQTPRPNGLGIAQYNARIFGLREKGHVIDNTIPGHFVLAQENVTAPQPKKAKKNKNPNKGRVISYWDNGQLQQVQL